VLHITSKHFHQPSLKSTLVRGDIIPRIHGGRASGQLSISGNPPKRFLPGKNLLAQLIPPLIKLSGILVRPWLKNLMRSMCRAGSPVHQKRVIRRVGTVLFQPGDGSIRKIL